MLIILENDCCLSRIVLFSYRPVHYHTYLIIDTRSRSFIGFLMHRDRWKQLLSIIIISYWLFVIYS